MCDVHYRLCAKSARKPRLSAPVSPRPLSPRHKRLFYHRLLFSKKKKTKKRQESLGFFVDVEQRVAVGTPLAGLLIPLSDMNSCPCFFGAGVVACRFYSGYLRVEDYSGGCAVR